MRLAIWSILAVLAFALIAGGAAACIPCNGGPCCFGSSCAEGYCVPEFSPATAGLVLAGVGAVAFLARRRLRAR